MSTDQPHDRSGEEPPEDGPRREAPHGSSAHGSDGGAGAPEPAPLGRRLAARIVDALIIGVPVALLLEVVFGLDYEDAGTATAQAFLYAVAYLLYEALMITRTGQTVGKKVMGVRVVRLGDGSVPAGETGWLRAAVYSLPPVVPCIGTLFWLVNVLFCIGDKPYRQCLHDKAAKTVVVDA